MIHTQRQLLLFTMIYLFCIDFPFHANSTRMWSKHNKEGMLQIVKYLKEYFTLQTLEK